MKVRLFVAAAGLAACAVAKPVELGGLPVWESVDTEVSTNCPFDASGPHVRHFRFGLDLSGTPSNNVEVAFGRDLDRDGVLSLGEADLTVGWDCGRWFMHGAGAGTNGWFTVDAATEAEVKSLEWDLTVVRGRAKELSCSENGVPLAWPIGARVPAWTYDGGWDMLRLTVRGVDAADESFRARVVKVGTAIMIR